MNEPVKALSDDALRKIEARHARCMDNKNQSRLAEASILIASDIPALCQTVRVLRNDPRRVWDEHPNRDGSGKKCSECGFDNRFHAYECFFHHPGLKISEKAFNTLHDEKMLAENENAALREQLAACRRENDRLSSQLKEWQEERDAKAGYL